MIKKLLMALIIVVLPMTSFAGIYPDKDIIKIDGEFNEFTVNSWIDEIDNALKGKPKGFTLDLYLNSPGGQIFAGNELIHSIMRKQSEGYRFRGIAVGGCMYVLHNSPVLR